VAASELLSEQLRPQSDADQMLAQLIVQIAGDSLLFVGANTYYFLLHSRSLLYFSLKEHCLLLHRHLQSLATRSHEIE
jgi:hypothetical protein